MTEEEWQTCQISQFMLPAWQAEYRRVHSEKDPERKLWLFGAAQCRRIQPLFTHELLHFSIEVIEGIADGMNEEAWGRPLRQMWEAEEERLRTVDHRLMVAVATAAMPWEFWEAYADLCSRVDEVVRELDAGREYASMTSPDILREIVGNPFRPVAFDPAWRTSTTVGLAAAMYDSRSFANMPILADALEEAGCDHPDVLAHCRDESATHVRGCWVVDLVLGKS